MGTEYWRETLGTELFTLARTTVSVGTLGTALFIFVASLVLSATLRKVIRRSFASAGATRDRSVHLMTRMTHYAVVFVGAGIALDTLGIDLAALFAAGAIFAVGLGFAMQSIAQNFVSGVILMLERTVSVGDVLKVEGQIVQVEEMNIRSTIVRTRDEEHIVVPNSMIVQSAVTNYTLKDSLYRISAEVGVTYSSDLNQVLSVLQSVASSCSWRHPAKEPRVDLVRFGASSVDFAVRVWIDDPWTALRQLSELQLAIWRALKDADIVIAFPQLDVHFDANIVDLAQKPRGPTPVPS